jgi:hypothetical protein
MKWNDMAILKKHKNSQAVKDFIKDKSALFWYIKESEKENISHEFLVETILNYGDEKDVKRLFELLGVKRVADIFHKQTNRPRVNYFPRTVHFFNLYFGRNA